MYSPAIKQRKLGATRGYKPTYIPKAEWVAYWAQNDIRVPAAKRNELAAKREYEPKYSPADTRVAKSTHRARCAAKQRNMIKYKMLENLFKLTSVHQNCMSSQNRQNNKVAAKVMPTQSPCGVRRRQKH
mmetsp:Transcript_49612/g.60035  ORF Transcript_49612/g.60035 Transcript_49612/m.60035 type:complete len:129 (+) Transcript_49612:156-542(+)